MNEKRMDVDAPDDRSDQPRANDAHGERIPKAQVAQQAKPYNGESGRDKQSNRDVRHRQPKERIAPEDRPFIRAENEDDDGYDPYSDRQPHAEPLFERDPWD